LARTVVDLLPRGGVVLDLYAGVGLFALPLAAAGADEVHAIESSPTAVEDASASARSARFANVRIRRADVGRALASLPVSAGERIVLDPPRTGAGRDVVRAVAARRPAAVVYVSCDPPTLGRDLAEFAREGLRPDLVRAFDMFPDTFHLETVVRLVPSQGVTVREAS
jgi:tRNA/tmRNA/rRNA uracil-C5-methylase (TrmA/RlmC/RlmD family)